MKNPEDIARYIRCNLLIGQVLTPILREYMQLNNIPPTTVYKTIMAKYCDNFRKKLSQKEMRIVQTLSSDGYNKFDITLMYKIARNSNFKMIINELPTRGWGTEPLHDEITIGDDIERIRLSRDHLMHNPNHRVSETEFILFFDKLVDVARRADEHDNRAPNMTYEQQMQDLRSHPIDPENTKILLETLEENKNLREKMDGTVRLKMVLVGTANPANLADNINSHREEIGLQCKDFLIDLDKASEGSLILYLEVQKRVFQSDSLLHAEMDRFLEIVFKVISFNPEITISSHILIIHDDSYESGSSSEDEDNPSVVIADKKLVLNLTVQNEAFQTDESVRQNLNSFVEALVKDMNGQEIKKGDNVTAVLRLNESHKEDNIPLEIDDKKPVLYHADQNKDVQTDQSMHQNRYGENDKTEMNSQLVQKDDGVTAGLKLNDAGTYILFLF
ncbi:unnamed protein product [Mytilus coruscus]|uniref:DZIP3-like HEPN domain-containing protein n=1 Tax=Mytilus coruscus TaxID=42192 RepID=A0A6J8DHQ3_MYTCO|nr:unnamed protein product [Mytilus coruscus]